MKKLFFILLSAAMVVLISCNSKHASFNTNSKGASESEKKEKGYNDSIQRTFFEVSFGASKSEVINKFKAHNLRFDKYNSSDEYLRFRSSQGRVFSFGGMSWEMLNVGLSNNRFFYINFMNAHKDKAAAIQGFKDLLSTISSKYNMVEETPKDSTVYSIYSGYSKRDPLHEVTVSVYRYETIGREIYNGVSLEYYDKDYVSQVSDEL